LSPIFVSLMAFSKRANDYFIYACEARITSKMRGATPRLDYIEWHTCFIGFPTGPDG
jgi:hypothetical protein